MSGSWLHWQSLSGFVAMGGYGLYVWGSYGIAALALGLEAALAVRRFRRAQAATAVHSEGVRR